ncbi:MAG: hypothetical protein LBJ94_02770 [Puniceicoccales bacterium]|jgi:hypothetical protein|nr:hypothetical protein [Puniceicoccales bacterium]
MDSNVFIDGGGLAAQDAQKEERAQFKDVCLSSADAVAQADRMTITADKVAAARIPGPPMAHRTASSGDVQAQEVPHVPGPRVSVCNPQSTVHTSRMEGALASVIAGNDPSKYCSARNYRIHLNAELLEKGSPFLLGDAFFEGSQVGVEWRRAQNEIPTIPEDASVASSNAPELQSEQEAALFREVEALWPRNASSKFSEFIFGKYHGIDGRRCDCISGEERQLLKNIVLQVKALKGELDGLQEQSRALLSGSQVVPKELGERIESLQSALASIDIMVRGHGDQCHARLQEIIRTAAQEIDRVASGSEDITSPDAVTKQILARYRLRICDNVTAPYAIEAERSYRSAGEDSKAGSFFREDHRLANRTKTVVNFDAVARGSGKNQEKAYLRGKFDEVNQAVRLVVSGAWGLHEAQTATSELHRIPEFQFRDFIDPFVCQIMEEEGGLPAIAAFAKEAFEGVGAATRVEFAKTFLDSEITFKDYCTIFGIGENETRQKFEAIIDERPEGSCDEAEASPASDDLKQWMSPGAGKMSLRDISKKFQDLDYMMEKAGECIPDLLNSCSEDNPPSDSMAKLLFPAYLYHVGALIRSEDVRVEDASTPHQIFSQELLDKTAERTEVDFSIFPEVFNLHPSYPDELYFETQVEDLNSCGIHALNNFMGKPIFDEASTEGAHILYKCFAERGPDDPLLRLNGIKEKLSEIKGKLSNLEEKLGSAMVRRIAEAIDGALGALEPAITAITTMREEGDSILKNNPLERYAGLAQDISKCLHEPDEVNSKIKLLPLRQRSSLGISSAAYGITDDVRELKESFSPTENGLDPVALRIVLEKQVGVTLHVESGRVDEIANESREGLPSEKVDFLEALSRDQLPGDVDRAIIADGLHFRCVRKLADGQWVLLDSDQKSGPITLPAGGLAKLLSDQPGYYEIMYCKSAEDQRKLEDFINQSQH